MSNKAEQEYFSQKSLWKPPVAEQVAVAEDLIAMIPEDVTTILDAGCGNGAVTNLLSSRWNVVGCDFSYAALNSVQAPTFVANLATTPLKDNSFDLVLLSDVLEHIPDELYKQVLVEISRIATKYILIAVPHMEILDAASVICPNCGNEYHAHHHKRSYTIEEFEAVLQPGFGATYLRLSGDRWIYSDRDIVSARQVASGLDYPFEDAFCDRCNHRRGPAAPKPVSQLVARRFESLQAMYSSEGHSMLPHRSEIIGLFQKGYIGTVERPVEVTRMECETTINLSTLPIVTDPKPYPEQIALLEQAGDHRLLFFPRRPRKIVVTEGAIQSLEIYNYVTQLYMNCPADDAHTYDIKAAPCGPFGYFLRIGGATESLALQIEYGPDQTRDKIIEECFGNGDLDSILHANTEFRAKIEAQETQRAQLEYFVQQRDQSISSLTQTLEQNWEVTANLEQLRAKLEVLIRERDRTISALEMLSITQLYHSNLNSSDQTSPMRILVLSHMYPRDDHPAGGIFVHEQVKALRALGIDARVMCGVPFWINTLNPYKALRAFNTWRQQRSYSWEDFEGVPLIRFPYIVSRRFLPFELHAASYRLALLRCMARLSDPFDFQLVHAHTAYIDGSAGAAVCKRHKLPLIITEHTGPFRTLTRNPILRYRTQRSLNFASKLIVVSTQLLSDIQSEVKLRHPEQVSVLPNLVDTAAFSTQPRAKRDEIEAIWIGHFVSVKRVDRLLRAFSIASIKDPRIRLKLVGSGVLESELRTICSELGLNSLVTFAGPASRTQLIDHLRDADFLVVSSDTETFGLVCIEALSCGRPVLATNCGGPSDIIVDSRLGRIVDRSDETLAEGFLHMVQNLSTFDPDLLHEYVERKFSSTAVATRLASIYSQQLILS